MVWRGANKNFFAGGGVWYLIEGWKYFKKGCSTREELKKMDGWGCDPPKKLVSLKRFGKFRSIKIYN